MTLSKEETIMALLNQWDPDGRYAGGAGFRAYSYEAETLAQSIRSNSRMETVERAIVDAFVGTELDETDVNVIARYIKATVKK